MKAFWIKRILQASFFVSEELLEVDSFAKFLLGGNREEEIPEPISNSEVKLLIADGTAHKSVGE